MSVDSFSRGRIIRQVLKECRDLKGNGVLSEQKTKNILIPKQTSDDGT